MKRIRDVGSATRCGVVGLLVAGVTLLAVNAQGQGYYRDAYNRACPVLDMPYEASQGAGITHVTGAGTGTTGWGDDISETHLQFWGRMGTWENAWGGELEVRSHLDLRMLEGFAAASGIDQFHTLGMLRAALVWHQRFLGGIGLQVRTFPGLYMAVDEPDGDVFAIPAGGRLIYAISPEWAVWAGADSYPGFDVEVDPALGFVYQYLEELRVQVGYPETRLAWTPYMRRFRAMAGATFSRWPEYRLGSGDAREWMRMLETRAYAGFGWAMSGGTEFVLQGGYAWDREIRFGGETAAVTIDDAPFVRLAFRGLL